MNPSDKNCKIIETSDEGYSEQRKIEIPPAMSAWSEEQKAEFAYSLLMTVSTSTLSALTQRLTPLLVCDFLTELPDELALRILEFSDYDTLCNASQVSRRWRQLCADQSLWKCLFQKSGWYYNRKLIRSYLDPSSTLPVSPYLATPSSQVFPHSQFLSELAIEVDGIDAQEAGGSMSGHSDFSQSGASLYGDHLSVLFPRSPRINSPPVGRSGLSPVLGLPLSRQASEPNTSELNTPSPYAHPSAPSSPMSTEFRRPSASPRLRLQRTPLFRAAALGSPGRGELVGVNELFRNPRGSGLASPSLGSDMASPSFLMSPMSDRMDFPGDEHLDSASEPIPGVGAFEPASYFHPLFDPSQHQSSLGKAEINWRKLYMMRQKLEENWASGSCSLRYIPGHSEGIYCIQFDELKIVSGSRDDTIRVWDMASGRCLRTFRGHRGSVLCLQYDGNLMVSGSSDSSIIMWELSSGKIIRQLDNHQDSVLNLRFDARHIVSCSKDRTVKVWDTATGKLLHTLSGHRVAVNAVQFVGNHIVSASGDRTIKLWDLQTGECLRTFSGHARGIACLAFDGQCIVSGSSDKTIKVWDAQTGSCLRTLSGHSELVRTLELGPGGRIVSGSYDQTVKVWDIRSGRMLLNLTNGHQSRVFKVQFSPTRIVSCSQDQNIAIWDFAHNIDTTFLV
ncbi:hypothetical protein DSO57_1007762 [Entomophthora muscae]|uniref:Uncharacterized protein n=1 Tax=Entomophthora muscae TaxID=34485 RepID=A0ACC2USX3_9FUNG|nr:hypothetical protein DSO57_1007762 [Entomophthora muscae]